MRSTADGEGERLSVDEARYWLGLPAARRGNAGYSMTSSSADSADIAAGRGSRSSVPVADRGGGHDPWDPSLYGTSQLPSPASMIRSTRGVHHVTPPGLDGNPADYRGRRRSDSASKRFGGMGGPRGGVDGGGGLPPPSDPFWNPVVPGVPATLNLSALSRDTPGYHQPTYPTPLSPASLMALTVSLPRNPRIDRPALRGQEYKRERRRGHQQTRPALDKGGPGSDAAGGWPELQEADNPVDDRWQFLGMRWPPGAPRGRSGSGEHRHATPGEVPGGSLESLLDGASDGLLDAAGEWAIRDLDGILDPGAVGDGEEVNGGRLSVWIDGSTELGKGFAGHTAYRIKVIDKAIGEEWTVLRRFRQFEMLHEALLPVLAMEPDANAYALPPKEVFGGRHGGVIAKRLKLLKVYLDRLVGCRTAVEHRALSSFLELDPCFRGLGAYARHHGPECIIKEGRMRVKEWKGPHKSVINILEAGFRFIGWVSAYVVVSPGPVFLVYRGSEDDPDRPIWSLPTRRTIGSQIRVRRVDMWKADLKKEKQRFFLVSWESTSLLCEVESDADLESWAHAITEDVDLRPMQSELDRAKVDIELKAKEAWTSREEGIWGGL